MKVVLRRGGGIIVEAYLKESGDLVIDVQDLVTLEVEYEYVITVAARHVPLVAEALGGGDVLALLEANSDTIYRTGERTWLDRHGVPYEFWSRMGE